jgi:hypothetical protein
VLGVVGTSETGGCWVVALDHNMGCRDTSEAWPLRCTTNIIIGTP